MTGAHDTAGGAPGISLVPAPGAPAGGGDPTRRWALAFPDGVERFPGVARHEGARAAPELESLGPAGWDDALVEVALPVVLCDGAGPHLLDAEGRLVLGLGPHPAVAGARVAMGQPTPGHLIGAVRRRGGGIVWSWLARAAVAPARRVEALDALAEAPDQEGLRGWQARWREIGLEGSSPAAGGAA